MNTIWKWILGLIAWGIIASQEEDVRYVEQLGVVLEQKGYLYHNQDQIFYSTFIKLADPLKTVNKCVQGCPESYNEFNQFLKTDSDCLLVAVRGKANLLTDLEEISLNAKDADTPGARRGMCIIECLRDNRCQALEVSENQNDETTNCKLRRETLQNSERQSAPNSVVQYNMKRRCLTDSRDNLCTTFIKSDPVGNLISKENEKLVNSTWEKIANLTKKSHTRKKRFFLGALSLLGLGLTTAEEINLARHVKDLRQEYEDFKNKQVEFDTEQLQINKNFMSLIRTVEGEAVKRLVRLECSVNSLGFQMLNMM